MAISPGKDQQRDSAAGHEGRTQGKGKGEVLISSSGVGSRIVSVLIQRNFILFKNTKNLSKGWLENERK